MEKIIIAAMSLENVIGNNNKIPWKIKEDMEHFRQLTIGHPVIMGRKTFDSILDSIKRPLPKRTNIVVTRNQTRNYDDVFFCDSLNNAFKTADAFDHKQAYVIGGGEIYRQALGLVDKLELTIIKDHVQGDTYFPEVNWEEWEEIKIEEPINGKYSFVTYKRK